MIFNRRLLNDISNDDIEALVSEKVAEQLHLEYKVTINLNEPKEKLEILKDVVSFTNANGGYIIIGIRDDGKGRAQKFEPKAVGNVDSIKKSVMSLCQDHIEERIDGLEVQTRQGEGFRVVIIRVPSGPNKPHMVKFENRTDFYKRFQDGKREMSYSEIRDSFNADTVAMRLSTLEQNVAEILNVSDSQKRLQEGEKRIKAGTVPNISLLENGKELIEVAQMRVERIIDTKPYLWLAATPDKPKVGLIDIDDDKIRRIIRNAPDSRTGGWNVGASILNIERFEEGIRRGREDFRFLELFSNGHSEFRVPIDENFCWKQDKEDFKVNPRLYPYPVVEYPLTFLKLYRLLILEASYSGKVIITMHYKNINNHYLLPFVSRDAWPDELDGSSKTFNRNNLELMRDNLAADYNPDEVTFSLVTDLYAAFGVSKMNIPFWNTNERKFKIF